MRITLLLVGKTNEHALQTMMDDYTSRLTHYAPFALQIIPELKNAKSMTEAQQKTMEGEMILKALPQNACVILLDEHGDEYRSMEFASFLNRKMQTGCDIVFVVGGPYGFSPAVYARANGQLSLSRMTFSHQMIRLLFVEQLYRAFTILKGEPYHHE